MNVSFYLFIFFALVYFTPYKPILGYHRMELIEKILTNDKFLSHVIYEENIKGALSSPVGNNKNNTASQCVDVSI